MLVSIVRRHHCVIDAGLRAAVHVLDVVGILRLQLIEFVLAVADGVHLAFYPLLARERIHVTPESLVRLVLQRLARRIG